MKNIIKIIICVMTSTWSLSAQTSACYTYDADGNRIKASICVTSSSMLEQEEELTASIEGSSKESINTEDLEDILVYPNPTSGYLSVDHVHSRDADYTVFDMSGRELIKKTPVGREIDLRKLSNGQYILLIRDGDRQSRSKIIVQK